jgi:N-acetylglucosamine-6-phosphate deacetylase
MLYRPELTARAQASLRELAAGAKSPARREMKAALSRSVKRWQRRSPRDSLRFATVDPARAVGLRDRRGARGAGGLARR